MKEVGQGPTFVKTGSWIEEVEKPCILIRPSRTISCAIAPDHSSGEVQMAIYMHFVLDIGDLLFRAVPGIIDALQLLQAGQTPAVIACILQRGAVCSGFGLVHIRAVVVAGPQQPSGGIKPCWILRGIFR